MNDSFENIAEDAVDLLVTIIQDLDESGDPADQLASAVIANITSDLCIRALAIMAKEADARRS